MRHFAMTANLYRGDDAALTAARLQAAEIDAMSFRSAPGLWVSADFDSEEQARGGPRRGTRGRAGEALQEP
jgi:hypothetical protein